MVGENIEVGVYSTRDALAKAEALELDLVMITEKAEPPVCRIVDYKKFLYDPKKKQATPFLPFAASSIIVNSFTSRRRSKRN